MNRGKKGRKKIYRDTKTGTDTGRHKTDIRHINQMFRRPNESIRERLIQSTLNESIDNSRRALL